MYQYGPLTHTPKSYVYLFFQLVQKHKLRCLFEACLFFRRYKHANDDLKKKKKLTGLNVIKKNNCKAVLMAVNTYLFS